MSIKQTALTALALGALAVGVAAATADEFPFTDNTRDDKLSALPQAQTVGPAHRTIGVLRRERTAADNLPPSVAADLRREGLMGENPRLARKALVTDFGRTYYVLPAADDALCLVSADGGSICAPSALAASGKLTGTEACAPGAEGHYIQFGMVPDEAGDAVTMELTDGSVRRLRVEGNVYAVRLARRGGTPAKVSWQTASGVQAIEPYVDSGVTSARCAGRP